MKINFKKLSNKLKLQFLATEDTLKFYKTALEMTEHLSRTAKTERDRNIAKEQCKEFRGAAKRTKDELKALQVMRAYVKGMLRNRVCNAPDTLGAVGATVNSYYIYDHILNAVTLPDSCLDDWSQSAYKRFTGELYIDIDRWLYEGKSSSLFSRTTGFDANGSEVS